MQFINIKLENFEGPFDLLLHLIKKNEMNIYDIKIYDITNQYLGYLEKMQEMDLELTSEFIVMAATLLEIKSKMLLPKPKIEENEDESDPRQELVKKLIEYKKYKALGQMLMEKRGNDYQLYAKSPEIIEDSVPVKNEELLKGMSMLDLYNIFNYLMDRYCDKTNKINIIPKEIPIDKYKIEDKMYEIIKVLQNKKNMKFSDLEMICSCKMEVIVTFLAVLELIKEKEVRVIQPYNFDKIYIEGVNQSGKNISM